MAERSPQRRTLNLGTISAKLKDMKTKFLSFAVVAGMMLFSPSCTTTYDRYGNPVQSVDPGAAAAGVVAAGILGYALANSYDNHHHDNYYRGNYDRGHPYRGYGRGYSRRPYCR